MIIIIVIIIIKDLHLIMGQKHLIWDRVWDVKSRKSNLYLHIQYIYDAPMVLFLHENPLTSNLDIVDIPRYTDMYIYIYIHIDPYIRDICIYLYAPMYK